jgi:hypothetical protein
MTPFNLGAMLAAEKCAFLFEPVADYVNTAIGAGCRGTCISIIFNAG